MSGIGGIVSLSLTYPLERLKTVLSWHQPCVKSTKSECIEFTQSQNAAIGTSKGFFAHDEDSNLSVVFTGSLIKKKKLLESICKQKIKNENNPASIILAAYQTQGQNCFHLFDGEFSFAILSGKEKSLFLIRSKTGGEDLFWAVTPQALIFSSSLKGLMSTGQVAPSLDLEAISTYLALGYISQDKTPIQGINRVLPGYAVKWSFDGKVSINSFWSFSSYFVKKTTPSITSSEELFYEIGKRITNAVSERYVQDMPYPAIEGNNAPSQIIQEAFARSVSHSPLPTIPVQFDPLSLKERGQKTTSTFQVTPDKLLNSLVNIIWTTELPVGDPSTLLSWHFADMCHKHNLSPFFDTGFSAAFGRSQSTHPQNALIERFQKMYTAMRSQFYIGVSSLTKFFPQTALQALRRSQKEDPHIDFMNSECLLSFHELKESSPSLSKLFHPDLFLHQFYHLPRISAKNSSHYYLSIKTAAIDKIHTPRFKIAHAFETTPFAPFLDVELIEFLAAVHEDIWASPDILKSFPDWFVHKEIRTPDPIDFAPWFSHPAIHSLFNALRHGLLVESGYITHGFIDHMIRMRCNHSFQVLYTLLSLELWMRLFIDMPLSHTNGQTPISELLQVSQL